MNIWSPTSALKSNPRKSKPQGNSKQQTATGDLSAVSAGFVLGLLFDLDDRGGVFLQLVRVSPKYTVLQPTRPYHHKSPL
jgi:hypothetical protein